MIYTDLKLCAATLLSFTMDMECLLDINTQAELGKPSTPYRVSYGPGFAPFPKKVRAMAVYYSKFLVSNTGLCVQDYVPVVALPQDYAQEALRSE